MTKQKGFTLIELLVVIAIIGILAALVLVALGNARDKANDARIKSDIGQLRTIAEIIYDSNSSSYETGTAGVESCVAAPNSTTCTSASVSGSVTTLTADILSANANSALTAEATASAFCIEAKLLDDKFLCVDQTGSFKAGHTAALCADASESC